MTAMQFADVVFAMIAKLRDQDNPFVWEKIADVKLTLELRSRVRRSHCAVSRPPHTRASSSAATKAFRNTIVVRGGRY